MAYVVPAARLLCAGATPRYPAVAREFRLVLRSRDYAADIGQSSLTILSEAEGADLSVPRCILQPNRPEGRNRRWQRSESLQVIPCTFCTAAHARMQVAGTVPPLIPSVRTSSEELLELQNLRSRVC